jgi:DNA-binding transcriptional ArsR family regulator
MDMISASFAFAALSQPVRLDALRLLVAAGPEGLPAGDIADALGQRQNTMSANLAVLLRAGLVNNERDGRLIRYRANIPAIGALVRFLVADCCGGRPEQCAPILAFLTPQPACDC